MNLNNVTLVPAYGRDYNSIEEIFEDFWHKELDFKIAATQQYCSIRDFKNSETVFIRYNKLQDVTSIVATKY